MKSRARERAGSRAIGSFNLLNRGRQIECVNAQRARNGLDRRRELQEFTNYDVSAHFCSLNILKFQVVAPINAKTCAIRTRVRVLDEMV